MIENTGNKLQIFPRRWTVFCELIFFRILASAASSVALWFFRVEWKWRRWNYVCVRMECWRSRPPVRCRLFSKADKESSCPFSIPREARAMSCSRVASQRSSSADRRFSDLEFPERKLGCTFTSLKSFFSRNVSQIKPMSFLSDRQWNGQISQNRNVWPDSLFWSCGKSKLLFRVNRTNLVGKTERFWLKVGWNNKITPETRFVCYLQFTTINWRVYLIYNP